MSRRVAVTYAIGLLLACALAGCAGPVQVARLPTDAERCAFVSGTFNAGLCDFCR